MRILVLCGDRWHSAFIPRTALATHENDTVAFDWIENAEEWSARQMEDYAVIVIAKWNHVSVTDHRPWLTEEVQGALLNYARRGGGLLFIHSGVAGGRNLPGMRFLMGGAFLHHPPQCAVTVEVEENHPFNTDGESFVVSDEHYFVEVDDQQADILFTTTSEHGRQIGGWTRSLGEGRVCVLTPGHNLEVWLHPSYRFLIDQALRWCAGCEQ